MPDWTNTPEAFGKCLESLFRHTPPTALILDGACLFHATFQKLARMGRVVPEHVSLICSDPHETFEWCHPSVAHISWGSGKVIRRVVRWATNVGCGKEDRQKSLYKARFIEGGTVGPAPGR